jgi:SAM-dependent methyltransferase
MPFGTLVGATPSAEPGALAATAPGPARTRWPLPALAAWGLGWGLHALLVDGPAPAWLAPAAATALGVALTLLGGTRMRSALIALGFPLSWLASGAAATLPAWGWLLPLALLLLAYPLHAWRDAPLFPTPAGSLAGLASLAPLPAQARVLDAGCGLGQGLDELRAAYPQARLEGIEWSWPIALAARLRCGHATVRRGDMWAGSWQGLGLVYLFQRPESLPRAVEKAARELAPGAWLASLEFEATALRPQAVLQSPGTRPVWLYQAPFVVRRPDANDARGTAASSSRAGSR